MKDKYFKTGYNPTEKQFEKDLKKLTEEAIIGFEHWVHGEVLENRLNVDHELLINMLAQQYKEYLSQQSLDKVDNDTNNN